ncbi:hypothetical protein D3C77_644780 [compost metagenome]
MPDERAFELAGRLATFAPEPFFAKEGEVVGLPRMAQKSQNIGQGTFTTPLVANDRNQIGT